MKNRIKSYTIVLTAILIMMTVGLPVVQGREVSRRELEFETKRMDFEQDEDVNTEFDPRDPDPEHINFLQWQEDFASRGKEVPKGTYVGQYFSPSTLRYDYTPRRRSRKEGDVIEENDKRDSYSQDVGEYGVSIISDTIEFSADDIMSGASEFWVKMPIHASQLTTIDHNIEYERDIDDRETIRRYKSQTTIHPGFYIFEGKQEEFQIEGDYTSGIFDLRGEEESYSHANSIITKDNFYRDSVYQKINAIIQPDVEYTLAFLAITEDEPEIKMDEVQSEDSKITMKSMEMEGASFDLDVRRTIVDFQHPMCDFTTVKSSEEDLHMSPHFSFTFTSGTGRGSLFGASLDEESTVFVSDNIQFNENEVQNKYLSHYIPFKYDDLEGSGITPHIGVRLSDQNQDTFLNEDEGTSYYDWSTKDVDNTTRNGRDVDYGFEFNRFLLLSSYKFNHTTEKESHDANIGYTFEDLPQNFTFLAKEREDDFTYNKRYTLGEGFSGAREPIHGEIINEDRTTWGKGATHWLGETMRVGEDTEWGFGGRKREVTLENESEGEEGVAHQIFEYYTDYEDDFPERYFYDVHTANEWTEGRWNTIKLPPSVEYIDAEEAVKRGIPEGTKIRTRHRDYIIEVEGNVDDVEVDDDDGGLLPDNPWEKPKQTVMAIGNYIVDRVTGAIRRNLAYVRDQLEKVWVGITSFIGDMWERIQDVGEWIHRSVMSIVEFITQIAGDILDMAFMMGHAFTYTIGVVGMMIMTYGVVYVTDSLDIRKGDN